MRRLVSISSSIFATFATMIGLIDCNNFFVSCELTRRPELKGRPVIVCGSNNGCAVAMSNEAKALGVTRGIPIFKIRNLIEKYDITVLSADHDLYGKISSQVMSTIHDITDSIETYSIDEAFIDIPVKENEAEEFARYVMGSIMEATGIPVSIGISITKTLAKIAAHFAKRYPGYRGVCIMETPEKIQTGLKLTKINEVWGIGRKLAAKLTDRGITTAEQFSAIDESIIDRTFSINVLRTWRELHGKSCFRAETHRRTHETVSCTRTFAHDIYDSKIIAAKIAEYASNVAETLRHHNRVALTVEVVLYTNPYHTDKPQRQASFQTKIEDASDDTIIIATAAAAAFKRAYIPGYGYKRAGVIINKTLARNEVTQSLFADRNKILRRRKLMTTIDRINAKSGNNGKVKIAAVTDCRNIKTNS